MKTLHKINLIAFLITLALYVTIFLGMLAQFFLGFIQLILMLSITFRIPKSEIIKNHVRFYWLLTIGMLSLIIAKIIFDFAIAEYTLIAIFFVIPMLIAIYSVYITWVLSHSTINNHLHNHEN
jgi:hypothetical protein